MENNFEKIVIVISLIIGFLGGILLIAFKFPPVIPSVFISMAISVLVYHFLGGISEAGFNMGPVKMGGSIAALIGCAFVINHLLDQQVKRDLGTLTITKDMIVVDGENNKLGTLPLHNYNVCIDSNKQLFLNDTISLGKLKCDQVLTLKKDRTVLLNDSINLGEIKSQNITQMVLCNNFSFDNYVEVYYNLVMSPFSAECKFEPTEKARNMQIAYQKLPFSVMPVYKEDEKSAGCRTEIKFDNTKIDPVYCYVANNEDIIIDDFIDTLGKIYVVRVRQVDLTNRYFVQYQILSLEYKKA